jgi:hypothetical protein
MTYTRLSQKVFAEMLENVPRVQPGEIMVNEGVISSMSSFISLISTILEKSVKDYNLPETNKLILAESFPTELLFRVNKGLEEFTADSKKQLTIVTYTANEQPGQVGSHSPFANDGVRNIKPRLIDILPDPKYDGYSIARVGMLLEADVKFQVWGTEDKGVRERAILLRTIIRDNTWLLKHKGLREIIWKGSDETPMWERENVVKHRTEHYRIQFTDIQLLKEKNIEQVLISAGLMTTVTQ